MALTDGAWLTGQAINATGIGGNISESQSNNAGLGFGLNTGKSWNEGYGSSFEHGENSSYSENFSNYESNNTSDSWSQTYGSEASAKDIERADEANKKSYELWKAQADFNASEAEKQRRWQENLSNTAYQRAVKDLVKAGLNPYLAATSLGGAATPSGGIASSGLAVSHKANTYADQTSESHASGNATGHSEGKSESQGFNDAGGSNYSVGGSNNYGINFEVNSGSSNSNSMPAVGKIISDAVKTATASTSGKGQTIGQWQASVKGGGSTKSFKGFDGSGYDPAY